MESARLRLAHSTTLAAAIFVSTPDAQAQFERLFAQFRGPILNYLYRLLGDSALAEDLAQETFARAWQAGGKLREVENPRAWLYRVATNAARDHHRRARLIAWLPLAGRGQAALLDEPETEADPVENRRMRLALRQLSPDYRVPLVLYVCEEFSAAEIAATLSISREAVKQRLVRAREKLRLLMTANE